MIQNRSLRKPLSGGIRAPAATIQVSIQLWYSVRGTITEEKRITISNDLHTLYFSTIQMGRMCACVHMRDMRSTQQVTIQSLHQRLTRMQTCTAGQQRNETVPPKKSA